MSLSIGTRRTVGIVTSPVFGLQLNKESWQSYGLIAAARMTPNAGVCWFNCGRNTVKYIQPTLIGGGGGDLFCANNPISDPYLDDIGITTGTWSVIAWFTCVAAPAAGEYVNIFGRDAYVSESNNQGWNLQVTASDDAGAASKIVGTSFRNNGAANYRVNSGITVSAGSSYFIGMTMDGATRRIYVHGVSQATNGANDNPLSTTTSLAVGGKLTTSYQGFIEGRVYARELLAPEMARLMQESRDDLYIPVINQTPHLGILASGAGRNGDFFMPQTGF